MLHVVKNAIKLMKTSPNNKVAFIYYSDMIVFLDKIEIYAQLYVQYCAIITILFNNIYFKTIFIEKINTEITTNCVY